MGWLHELLHEDLSGGGSTFLGAWPGRGGNNEGIDCDQQKKKRIGDDSLIRTHQWAKSKMVLSCNHVPFCNVPHYLKIKRSKNERQNVVFTECDQIRFLTNPYFSDHWSDSDFPGIGATDDIL
jgi:hypothetical protein